MEPVKLDLKTLIVLGGFLVTMGGFYYTTEMRLERLESEIQAVDNDNKALRTWFTDVDKRLTRLSKKLKQIQEKKL